MKFTKLFFSADMLSESWGVDTVNRWLQGDLVETIEKMVNHINDSGGWTVTGWNRPSLQETDDDNVLADQCFSRICRDCTWLILFLLMVTCCCQMLSRNC